MMNPYHRTIANDTLDWCKFNKKYPENFEIFFKIRRDNHSFDTYQIYNDIIKIGWIGVNYHFSIDYIKEKIITKRGELK